MPLLSSSAVSFLLVSSFSADAFSVTRPIFQLQQGITVAKTNSNVALFVSTDPNNQSQQKDDIPTMDWLTDGLAKKADEEGNNNNNNNGPGASDMSKASAYMEEHEGGGDLGDVPIPTTGVSVADEMAGAQKDRFYTDLIPIKNKSIAKGVRVAKITSTASSGSFDPVRYLVGLSKQEEEGDENDETDNHQDIVENSFVMVDIPPFSPKLKNAMEQYMGKGGKLSAILVTSRDCIHYDDAPGVFTIRRADLCKWVDAFPDTEIIAYRLDIPRDCREMVTQRLDGYGPFALEEVESGSSTNITFVETGRPLTYQEWDHDVIQDVLAGKRKAPDNSEDEEYKIDQDEYSPEAIRSREEGKRVLAVYTPGRSYGSVSYVFPEIGFCASGFTIPVEDNRADSNYGMDSAGPALDCRGYITTNRAGISRQMESARTLIENYADRFSVVLPSGGGEPLILKGSAEKRKAELLEIVDQYEKIGEIYEQLGITG